MSLNRFAEAEAAFQAGRRDEGKSLTARQLEADPDAPDQGLTAALRDHFPGRRPTLVLGALADKDWREMAQALVPLAGRVITAPVASGRTVSAEELRAACVATGAGRPVKAATSAAEALRLCAADPFVLVTGSLYFLGEILELLGQSQPVGAEERSLNEWSPPR